MKHRRRPQMDRETASGIAKVVGIMSGPWLAWSQAGASLALPAIATAFFTSLIAGAAAVSLWFSSDPRPKEGGTP